MQNSNQAGNYPYELARVVNGKRFYVVYKVYSIKSGKLVRKRKYFNNIKNEDSRVEAAINFVNSTNKLLATGKAYLKFDKDEKITKSVKLISIERAFHNALGRKKTQLRQSTYDSYRVVIENYMKFIDSSKAIQSLSPGQAKEYSNYLLIERKLAVKTHNGYIGYLQTLCNEMVKEFKYIVENPFDAVRMLKPKTTMQNRALFRDERNQLLSSIRHDDVLQLSCELQYYCFLRPNELRQIRICDVDLENYRITIHGAIAKNGYYRVVEIPNFFRNRIDKLNLKQKPGGLSLVGFREKPYSKNVMWSRHRKIVLKLKLDENVTLPRLIFKCWYPDAY